MSFLDTLPAELICHVLAFLSCQDLRALRLTSQFWNKFIDTNDSAIYHQAAVLHNFASRNSQSLNDALVGQGNYVRGVDDWRTLCQRRLPVEATWARFGYHSLRFLVEASGDVHRIKVDEERGLIITTHTSGGLTVTDMDTEEVLWSLPLTYVRSHAHCEYDNGFMIFDRLGEGKEIWRLLTEYHESPCPPAHFRQGMVHATTHTAHSMKGCFRPWALITTPIISRAFRFVYPVLLVAGTNTAHLYDVESATLVQTIHDTQVTQDGEELGHINYVEISSLHVFICGARQLRIFERGSGTLLHCITSSMNRWNCINIAADSSDLDRQAVPNRRCLIAPLPYHQVNGPSDFDESEFVAVHVSPDGKTIAALLNDIRLLVIKYVDRLAKGELTLDQCAVMVHFTYPVDPLFPAANGSSIYLAFEYGRVGVITSTGLFAITLDSQEHHIDGPWLEAFQIASNDKPLPTGCPFPNMVICRILPFRKKEYLERVTCLQMTRSRIFLTYNPSVVARKPQPQPQALEMPYYANMDEYNMDELLEDHLQHTDVEEGDFVMFDGVGDFEDGDFPIPDPIGDNGFAEFIEYFRMGSSRKAVACLDFTPGR